MYVGIISITNTVETNKLISNYTKLLNKISDKINNIEENLHYNVVCEILISENCNVSYQVVSLI